MVWTDPLAQVFATQHYTWILIQNGGEIVSRSL